MFIEHTRVLLIRQHRLLTLFPSFSSCLTVSFSDTTASFTNFFFISFSLFLPYPFHFHFGKFGITSFRLNDLLDLLHVCFRNSGRSTFSRTVSTPCAKMCGVDPVQFLLTVFFANNPFFFCRALETGRYAFFSKMRNSMMIRHHHLLKHGGQTAPCCASPQTEPRSAGASCAALRLTAAPSQAVHSPHCGQLVAAQG